MAEQNGIGAYAAYLPAYALRSSGLDGAEPRAGGPARSVAAFDEDSVTMAVEALREIADGTPPGRQLLLATTSAPYDGKTAAGIAHEALGLDAGVAAADLRGHRAGATALDLVLRAGAAAALADVRTTRAGAPDELAQGDAAAAFTAGDAAAVLLSRAGRTVEVLDRWRLPGERHDHVWDERFTAGILAAAGRRPPGTPWPTRAWTPSTTSPSRPPTPAPRPRSAGRSAAPARTPRSNGSPATPAPRTPASCWPRRSTRPGRARPSCCSRRPRERTRSSSGPARASGPRAAAARCATSSPGART
ncbi:hypothetical protein ACQEU6_03630 [Spirillospora sp. CA-108201]